MAWDRQITIKTSHEIEVMRMAGKINAEALAAAKAILRPGITTAELNAAAEEVMKKHGVKSPFYHYPGPTPYPASTTISVNEELVHGIPGKRKLKEGDIVSIDSGVIYEGYVADSAISAGVGQISEAARRLLEVTEGALYEGIRYMKANNRVGDVSAAVQKYVESRGFSVTREYTGHGVGRQMHEGPQVPNYGTPGRGMLLRPGMTIALEPMVLERGFRTKVLADGWTVVSEDSGLTAHFEHTVAITENGPYILTVIHESDTRLASTGQSQ